MAVSHLLALDAFNFARKCLLLLYMPRQWYSANAHRKTFMVNYNERDLYYPGMEPRLIDSQGNAIQIDAVIDMIVL